MGRLSDARKKVKGGAAKAADATPPAEVATSSEPTVLEPVSFAAEGRKLPETLSNDAGQRLADELLAGIDVEEADEIPAGDAVTDFDSLPSSGLAEDLLAEMERRAVLKAAASLAKGKPSLMASSGLAEDILRGDLANATFQAEPSGGKAAGAQSNEFMSAWPSDSEGLPKQDMSDAAFLQAHQLGDDVLALMGNEPPSPKKLRGPGGLPSSGLADDILRDMPAPSVTTPLGVDEVHEFEAFFEEERAAEQLQLVLFQMENEVFALEIDRVQEIIRVPAITRVPHSLDAVRGVCNLRGRIVPVLDLRKLMRMVPKTIDRFNRIMVLDVAGKRIGVLIDRVSEVARINVPDVEPPPEELRAIDANLVTAVARLGERMIFILDVDRVLALK